MNSFTATVLDIREQSRSAAQVRWQLLLDRSSFVEGRLGTLHAVGRSGATLTIPVLALHRDSSGELWHIVEKPLAAGTPVTCVLES